ncbi:hypothetical protein [Methylobacterium sp. WL120]|uniref:hypothetical protein n=1 Tax=Methylobacterium sp. WL120 TaxID=2603887 RepID=UPI0011CB989F|nr:hypothetical protein [Methylobacterium sp. WL120]TXM68050.1 hypothetical protein FV229_08885 [Methylobacterium sp. WL120]
MRVSGPSPIASTPPPSPAPAVAANDPRAAPSPPLDPAVRLDIRVDGRSSAAVQNPKPVETPPAGKTERRVTVDADTKSIVYQVIDSSYGNVVVQLPDPAVLKSRAYAEAAAAKVQTERPVDRTA